MQRADQEFDYVVIGSGGGGMASAIVASDQGLETLVVEKSEYYGGTTALSGGVVWVPNNHLMAKTGIADSADDGYRYLSQITHGEVDPKRLRAYVDQAPEMVRYFEDNTHVKFNPAEKYCDYYPELDGGKLGARSLDPRQFSRRKLGDKIHEQRPARWKGLFDRLTLTARESHFILDFNYKTVLFLGYRLLLHFADLPGRIKGLPDDRATLGQALVAGLRRSLLDRDVPLWLNCPAETLVVEDGRVVGITVRRDGEQLRIAARKGILLATGGFAHDAELRQQYQAAPIGSEWTAAAECDTGDGLRMGRAVGADLQFMHCAWWTPIIKDPGGDNWALVVGKAMPGSIFVNKAGRRFVNEAAPYEDVVKGQIDSHAETPSIPCYMVFDASYRHKYPIGQLAPSKVVPDDKIPSDYRAANWLKRADTLAGLAQQLDIDGQALEATVARFNADAAQGIDPQFGRGLSASDRYYSDARNKPNPCLAPLTTAPYYAVEIYPGDLGTKGGLKCNDQGQVLDVRDAVIPGLYATGNCSGAVMGDSYPGAGATIGSAMTFGYIAARHAAAT